MNAPAPDELLVVVASLDVSDERREQLLTTFAPRERERYQSFRHDEHRFRWGASRGLLREILGSVLGIGPAEVRFAYGAHGKPGISGSRLRFNLSHSAGLGLLVIGYVEVGADVELPRERRSDDIARRFFTPKEIERLFALDKPARDDAFFRLWTCKEAFLKCTGEGLSRSTRSYEIDLGPSGARLVWADGVDAARYSLFPLTVPEPYRGAVFAEGKGLSVRQESWPT
ncbi:MAG TPA: 4'-phosphopantetheinyl transferase superfamily protein [Myxococcales bacterium]|jgi:4'-phosphopantetheinyl transferase